MSIPPKPLTPQLPSVERIGRKSANSTESRPMRLRFLSLSDRHDFLKYASQFRPVGIRLDDDLTRLQQQQRQAWNDDFQLLKAKGCKPLCRGAWLRCRVGDKSVTCNKGQAANISAAQ